MYVCYASVNIISIVFNIPRMSSQHRQHHQQIGFPHRGKSEDSIKGAGRLGRAAAPLGSPPMMIEKLGAKNLKSNGRMMIEKVMIQLGANIAKKVMIQWAKKIQHKKQRGGGGASVPLRQGRGKKSKQRGGWGGRQPPHDDRKSDDSIRGKKSKN